MNNELKKLLDTLNIGYLLVEDDQNNTILDVNKAFVKMTGMSRKSIVGLTSIQFYGESEYRRKAASRDHDTYWPSSFV
jgi:PAS domain S-box-containing protein